MVKVLFVGPSLYGPSADLSGIDVRPPARQGDLARAVVDGADAIGLVDGLFETVASVWHKEILFALSEGVAILGAASMGALRAAECHDLGMMPVGRIAQAYIDGTLDDDAAVAQLHAPKEFGFEPLTEALVDAGATIDALAHAGLIDAAEAHALYAAARALFFKERTFEAIAAGAGLEDDRRKVIAGLLRNNRVSLKQQDALLLVDTLAALPSGRNPPPAWHPTTPFIWRRTLRAVRQQSGGGSASGAM